MHGILRPRTTIVRPSLTKVELDLDALTNEFLGETRAAALLRFDGRRIEASAACNALAGDCRTAERTVTSTTGGCSGSIVAHVSAPAFAAWAASGPGFPAQREAHVLGQLQLVLQDLCDHDVHSCLALTEMQCDVYGLDVEQLVVESLDRTTFSRLGKPAAVRWEGTLVKSLDPPALVLVVSIDLAVPA